MKSILILTHVSHNGRQLLGYVDTEEEVEKYMKEVFGPEQQEKVKQQWFGSDESIIQDYMPSYELEGPNVYVSAKTNETVEIEEVDFLILK